MTDTPREDLSELKAFCAEQDTIILDRKLPLLKRDLLSLLARVEKAEAERDDLRSELDGTKLLQEPWKSLAAKPTETRDRLMREGNARLLADEEFGTFLQDAACELTLASIGDRVYRKLHAEAVSALQSAQARADTAEAEIDRAAALIDAMSDYIGKMALSAEHFANLNAHWLFMERRASSALQDPHHDLKGAGE